MLYTISSLLHTKLEENSKQLIIEKCTFCMPLLFYANCTKQIRSNKQATYIKPRLHPQGLKHCRLKAMPGIFFFLKMKIFSWGSMPRIKNRNIWVWSKQLSIFKELPIHRDFQTVICNVVIRSRVRCNYSSFFLSEFL